MTLPSTETRWVIGLLLLMGLLYLPIRNAGFVYDDHMYVENNLGIRAIRPFDTLTNPNLAAAANSQFGREAYRPIVTLSYAVDYALWGLSPRAFHLENVFWALLNGILVWLFLRKQLNTAHARVIALAVFLFHPTQVQAIAWISQRSTLLASTGMLASLLLLSSPGPWNWKRLVSGWGAFLFGMLCRETAGGVLLALALTDQMEFTKKRRSKFFFARYVGLILIIGVYFIWRSSLLPRWSHFEGARQGWHDLSLGLMAFSVYLGKLVWPSHLRIHYAYPEPNLYLIAGAAMILLFYLGMVGWGIYKKTRWAAPLAWIIIFLIPVLQIIPIRAFAAERYLYFSLIGFAWLIGLLATRFPHHHKFLWIVIAAYATTSAIQVPLWKSDQSLWKASVETDPRDAFAHMTYSSVLPVTDEAEYHMRQALQEHATRPVHVAAFVNLSWAALQTERYFAAETWARAALNLDPGNKHAAMNLTRAVKARSTKTRKRN